MKTMNSKRQEIISQYASGLSFAGQNLSGLTLSGINLSGANLQGANLRQTNLVNVNFINANLRGVDFRGARLYDQFFDSIHMPESYVDGELLEKVYVPEVYMGGVSLRGAKLEKAIASEAQRKYFLHSEGDSSQMIFV